MSTSGQHRTPEFSSIMEATGLPSSGSYVHRFELLFIRLPLSFAAKMNHGQPQYMRLICDLYCIIRISETP
jgi:hypothetical protein